MSNTSKVGLAGKFLVGASEIANVDSINFNWASDPQETTTFQSGGWKEFLGGLKSANGTVEGNYSTKAATSTLFSMGTLHATLVFNMDGSSETFTGSGIVTNFNVVNKVGTVTKFTANVQFSGPINAV